MSLKPVVLPTGGLNPKPCTVCGEPPSISTLPHDGRLLANVYCSHPNQSEPKTVGIATPWIIHEFADKAVTAAILTWNQTDSDEVREGAKSTTELERQEAANA